MFHFKGFLVAPVQMWLGNGVMGLTLVAQPCGGFQVRVFPRVTWEGSSAFKMGCDLFLMCAKMHTLSHIGDIIMLATIKGSVKDH